jgi:uncharacterized protein YlxP (DUF503 family)
MENKFFVGQCDLDLHVENCQSLKEKRRIIKSLKEKLKNRYNISICEFGDLSLWQRVQLGIVICSNDKSLIDSTMKTIINHVDRIPAVSLLNFDLRII